MAKSKIDIYNLLKCINSLNEYISATQSILIEYSNCNIRFDMSIVHSLKKIRSLEIEYFNKHDENGAAFTVFELMLRLPPSNTWSQHGAELISLLQYWLEALKKHIIFNNDHWWIFLNNLLGFIEKISLKSTSIKNILVQETAESLLDLATNDKPDLTERYKILHCFNLCCVDCSEEIRTTMRSRLSSYFTRLSSIMSTCADVNLQFEVLEALLRWLLPRQDPTLWALAAQDWFPPHLYGRRCVDIFHERRWHNFFQDARDFLNAHNEDNNVIASVACNSFAIGNIVLISEADEKKYWVDINTGSGCISLMLEPELLKALDAVSYSYGVLFIHESNVEKLYLQREGAKMNIVVTTIDPQLLFPSNVLASGESLTIVMNSADVAKVDAALRTTFQNKYWMLSDLAATSEKNLSFSTTAGHAPRPVAPTSKHSGHFVNPRAPVSRQSPPTASTSSLNTLRDKVTAFPGFIYNKEPVSVCAVPQLSIVTEVAEPEEKQSLNSLSSLKLQSCGFSCKSKVNPKFQMGQRAFSQELKEKRKCISPVLEEEESNISCFLVATIGCTDDSIINDTLNRIPKEKDIHTDNTEDLLTKEALLYKQTIAKSKAVNEINTGNNNGLDQTPYDPNSNFINNTKKDKPQPYLHKKQTVISNTTTDDSNFDIVEDTPVCVRKNKKYLIHTDNRSKKNLNFDQIVVENFYSQHINENSNRELLISPILARKMNESSNLELEFDLLPSIIDDNFNMNDIVVCLNEMVDKVCKNLENCSADLGQDISVVMQVNNEAGFSKPSNLNNITNISEEKCIAKKGKPMPVKPIKSPSPKTPNMRRKRKLYSPKDYIANEKVPKISELHSPRSKKLNDTFDNLKSTVEGENNNVLAKINTHSKFAIYDFPGSQDEDFKDKEVFKKRNKKKVNFAATRKSTKIRKPNKKKNKQNRIKTSKNSEENSDKPQIRFEQMRRAPPERLEVAFVASVSNQREIGQKDLEPVIAVMPEMDLLNDDEFTEDVQSTKNRNKLILIEDKPDDKDITVSPMPGLITKTVPLVNIHKKDSISSCILEELNNISVDKNVSLSNKKQNFISDIQEVHSPLHDDAEKSMATIDQSKIRKNKHKLSTRKNTKKQGLIKVTKEIPNSFRKQSISNPTINLDSTAQKNFLTDGKTPIRAHVDSNEKPPGVKLLREQADTQQERASVDENGQFLAEYASPKRKKLSNNVQRITNNGSKPSTSRSSRTSSYIAVTPRLSNAANTTTENEIQDFKNAILENTSRKMAKMFVEMQKQLDEDMDRRTQQIRKAAAYNLVGVVLKTVDASLQQLDHKERDFNECLITDMRQKMRTVLLEVRRQKADMIAIVEEEIRASREHPARGARRRNEYAE